MPIVSQNKAETRERRLYKSQYQYISLRMRSWKRLIPRRRLGVCQLQASDDHECFGKRNQYVSWSLDPNMNAVGRRVVNVMLKHSCVYHRDGGHDKAGSHLQDRAEIDLVLAKQWVNDNLLMRQPTTLAICPLSSGLTIKKRNEDDQCNWVEVL